MDPKCPPKGALEASKRPLGAESGFRVLFGVILDPPKSSKMELKFDQKSSAYLEVAVWQFGGDLGVILGTNIGPNRVPMRARFLERFWGGSLLSLSRGALWPLLGSLGTLRGSFWELFALLLKASKEYRENLIFLADSTKLF